MADMENGLYSGANAGFNANGTITIDGGCLDITGANYSNGTLVELWTCNGGANQQWEAENGELVNPTSRQCLDDPDGSTTNGTQLQIYGCWGGSNQKWTVP
jgi:formylmethanofuran dehydrogenase subunit C